jgi:hypothetical protein
VSRSLLLVPLTHLTVSNVKFGALSAFKTQRLGLHGLAILQESVLFECIANEFNSEVINSIKVYVGLTALD